jgi:hypothetical protein
LRNSHATPIICHRPADTSVVEGRPGSSHGDAAASSDAGVCWGGIGDDDKTRAPAYGRGHMDAVPEEFGGALYDEQPEPETLGAGYVCPVKGPDNIRQIIGGNAHAAVAYLEAHL